MEKEPIMSAEQERLNKLADRLESIVRESTNGRGHVVMEKVIRRLRTDGAESAKVFLSNEADKFSDFRDNALPLIVQELYGGTGSPWFSIEKKLKSQTPQ